MKAEDKDFIAGTFWQAFMWLDGRDISALYEKMKEGIYQDIIECADEEFNSSDVYIAMRRVLFKKLGIQD